MGAVDVTAATEHAKKKQREEGINIIPIAGSHIRHKHLIEANHSTHRDECLQCKNKPPCFSAQIRHIYNLVILSEKFI